MQEETLDPQIMEIPVGNKQITAVVVANPTAGSYTMNRYHIEESMDYLRENGWQVELWLTQKAGQARDFARKAVEQQASVVIAVGGDGTLNEIIQELANSETALGVLPSGTVNVWARETGIPTDNMRASREILVHGRTRSIDLGQMGDRYFLLMTGIGFDGEVTRAVEKKSVKRFGVLSYLFLGTWLGLSFPSFRVTFQIGERTFRTHAIQIIIGNTQLYAGTIKYTWKAKCDDGLIDVCIVRKQNMLGRIAIARDFVLGREQRRNWIQYETCKDVKIHTRRPVAIQVDGDSAGDTPSDFPPMTFCVVPAALKVIVPNRTPEDLFEQP